MSRVSLPGSGCSRSFPGSGYRGTPAAWRCTVPPRGSRGGHALTRPAAAPPARACRRRHARRGIVWASIAIAAIAPDGETDRRGFNQAAQQALDRLQKVEEG